MQLQADVQFVIWKEKKFPPWDGVSLNENKSFQGFEDVEMNCKIFIRNVKFVESSLCIETVRQY